MQRTLLKTAVIAAIAYAQLVSEEAQAIAMEAVGARAQAEDLKAG